MQLKLDGRITTTKLWIGVGLCAALIVAVAAQGQEGGRVGTGSNGFTLAAANDGSWRLRLRSVLQVDGRVFPGESAPDEDNEWILRRVRPTFEGDAGERVTFRVMPDFGGGRTEVPDAWIETKLVNGLRLRVGKFKPPVGLERLQSAAELRLIERAFPTELVPRRDIGVQLSGGDRVAWQIGLFNGVNDGQSGDDDDDGNQELAARIFATPFDTQRDAVLGLGLSATYGKRDGTTALALLPGYRSPGQNVVFSYRSGADGTFASGERLRVSPQAYWYRGPLGFVAEWARVRQDVRRVSASFDRAATLDHDAWQLTAEWFLTGEPAGARDPNSAGAVQLVGRLTQLGLDSDSHAGGIASFADPDTSVREARSWAIGVNWFPILTLKVSLVYQHTEFWEGAPTGDRPDENVLLVRFQHAF